MRRSCIVDTVKKAQNVKKRKGYETRYNSSSDSNKYGESVNRRIKVTQERLTLWGGGNLERILTSQNGILFPCFERTF